VKRQEERDGDSSFSFLKGVMELGKLELNWDEREGNRNSRQGLAWRWPQTEKKKKKKDIRMAVIDNPISF
jgi:hypothetical protein